MADTNQTYDQLKQQFRETEARLTELAAQLPTAHQILAGTVADPAKQAEYDAAWAELQDLTMRLQEARCGAS